ncbi:ubiquitin carboxyl-terminal hydrolase [Achlya hypogyna]|uniref:Ubiquitin carboxyl-terminal hydrolase n=1 Tax=Achlya hypogyna TaxID=1202772 RepID=A0A1V9YQX3_ACHHY|nr:ubiquitin carboxyl-terminal hydrolase [Achlya hypogyna]
MTIAYGRVAVATETASVYKDECMVSFDTPFLPGGIYTNLSTFESFGEDWVEQDAAATGQRTYLHQKFVRIGVVKQPQDEVTKLAIGVEGGFQEDKVEIQKTYTAVVFNGDEKVGIPLDDPELPSNVRESIAAILNHQGNYVKEHVKSWQHVLQTSVYALELVQLPKSDCHAVSPNPAHWVCAAETCEKKENLWMNLSDGFVGCGRQNFDGTGGCGEALRHYEATGKVFPLAVKLGTITASGGGDVFSYPEDDMVSDPYLADHLRHFGIRIDELTKTDKTVSELEVELNKNWDFDSIMEEGKSLVPITGKGFMGLTNLGNSCYVNSVLQLLVTIPEVQARYLSPAVFSPIPPRPALDLPLQFSKVVRGIYSDRYISEELRPLMFRSLVGAGHTEFSSNRQQDAMEYIQHLLDTLTTKEKAADPARLATGPLGQLPTSALFDFSFEDRIECVASRKVKYVTRHDNVLQLSIPLDAAVNDSEVQENKRQRLASIESEEVPPPKQIVADVPFAACLEQTFASEIIDGVYSTATGRKGKAAKTIRFRTFPKYLLVQMKRYYVAEDWSPKKMDVSVQIPQTIRLGAYRSTGLQDDEQLLPEDAPTAAPEPSPRLVAELMAMGFSENGCKRAALATHNGSAEAAMEWIFAHMGDSDFNDPPTPTGVQAGPNPAIANLAAMGFSEAQAACALDAAKQDPDAAAEWLFSHMDDLDAHVRAFEAKQSPATNPLESTTCDEYELLGFVSHMGSNTHSGHYVAHLKKDGQWVFFNDAKVAVSDTPPFGAGFIYLFERKH